ncbi:hypothetical protein [Faecalibaculum rodentium]|uniref:hypothetical protein n=1 Tax=Faecalibaculum rodentium TaxID=1702221 RepID=UPI00259B8032|nr:hypothetical protein [Faecalibaculum rodentium]
MKSTGFIEARKERAVAINKSCHKRIEECFAGTLQQEQLILLLHGYIQELVQDCLMLADEYKNTLISQDLEVQDEQG